MRRLPQIKTGAENKIHTNAHQPFTDHSPTEVSIPLSAIVLSPLASVSAVTMTVFPHGSEKAEDWPDFAMGFQPAADMLAAAPLAPVRSAIEAARTAFVTIRRPDIPQNPNGLLERPS
jgi:hypothetical protein